MMQVDKSPSFRKTISPGSDSDSACWVMVLVMLLVAFFAIDGIKVAGQIDAYNDFVWVPVLLFSLSVIVFVANLVRLAKRYGRSTAM